ncbi:aminopeptidase Y [Xylariomycetidae sp. FL2044]|nr:aminopeptidase Y [Xylariomycetidae sp. FL2044]
MKSTYHLSAATAASELQESITIEALMARAAKLQEIADASPVNRVYTGEGFSNTVQYIVDTLEQEAPGYYDIVLQPTVFEVALDPAPLTVNDVTYATSAMDSDGGLPAGTFTGVPIVAVADLGCTAEDYPAAVSGAIALVERGECDFGLKSSLAAAAGALAAVIYMPDADTPLVSGTLGDYAEVVPTTALLYVDAQAILALIGAAPTNQTVTADLDISITNVYSTNVIATTKSGDAGNVLMLGGHADGVEEGPGINDNGSGSVALLETAVQLAALSGDSNNNSTTLTNAVRFAWWTGEESGLLGSYYYTSNATAEELAKVRLYLNFDMVASPNYVLGIYDGDGSAFNLSGPAGSDAAERLFEDYFDALGLPHDPSEFSGRSDYAGFIDHGVPAGGLFSGADGSKTEDEVARYGGTVGIPYDPNYHSAGDDLANLDETCFLIMSKAIAHSVATYASSWEGFPARNQTGVFAGSDRRRRRAVAKARDALKGYRMVGHGKKWLV